MCPLRLCVLLYPMCFKKKIATLFVARGAMDFQVRRPLGVRT